MEMKTLRNVSIVVAIGVGVYFIPGGGNAARTVEAILWVLAAVAIGYFGLRLYRENQFRLSALGDRHRGLLYGALSLAVFCYMAHDRMTNTGLGTLAWIALLAVVVWALLEVYRHARSYS